MPPSISIDALPGTGKTTLIVECVRRMFGRVNKKIPWTHEQQAVLDIFKGQSNGGKILNIAFNNTIAEELAVRMPAETEVKNTHKFGMAQLKQSGYKANFDDDKALYCLAKCLKMGTKPFCYTYPKLVKPAKQLFGLFRTTEMFVEVYGSYSHCALAESVADFMVPDAKMNEALDKMRLRYNVALEDVDYIDVLYENFQQALIKMITTPDYVDFADMLFLPLVYPVRVPTFDMIVIDERQDFNYAQQELVLRSAQRILMCGDTNQAVNGFAGADLDACKRLDATLSARPNGLVRHTLTITQRCSKAIVRHVNQYLDTFKPLPDAVEGSVSTLQHNEVLSKLQPGDMVVCRTNKPVIKLALEALASKKPIHIHGKDIGTTIIKNLDDVTLTDNESLAQNIANEIITLREKLILKRKLDTIAGQFQIDLLECLLLLAESCPVTDLTLMEQVIQLKEFISNLFTNLNDKNCITFCSIHKSKGLEANNVFFIHENECPHPKAKSEWELQQEKNLRIVACTRGKINLYLSKSPSKLIPKGKK